MRLRGRPREDARGSTTLPDTGGRDTGCSGMRLRNRVIKAGFWTDADLIRNLPPEGRMYYIGLVQIADDSGCLEADPLAHKVLLYPGDAISLDQIEEWQNTLIKLGKLVPYEVAGRRYLWLKNFAKHQSLRSPAPPEVPLPPWITWGPSTEPRRSGRYVISQPYGDRTETVATSNGGDTETVSFPVLSMSMSPSESLSVEEGEESEEREDQAEAETAEATETEAPEVHNGRDLNAEAKEFHAYYCRVWSDVFPRGPRLTEDRRRKIIARLKTFTLDELKLACDALHRSPFHRGENDAGKPYGTIDFLIRSDSQVDKWLGEAVARPIRAGPRRRPPTAVDLMLQEEGIFRDAG